MQAHSAEALMGVVELPTEASGEAFERVVIAACHMSAYARVILLADDSTAPRARPFLEAMPSGGKGPRGGIRLHLRRDDREVVEWARTARFVVAWSPDLRGALKAAAVSHMVGWSGLIFLEAVAALGRAMGGPGSSPGSGDHQLRTPDAAPETAAHA